MASKHTDSVAVCQSVEISPDTPGEERSRCHNRHALSIEMPPEQKGEWERAERAEASVPPSQDNCDGQHDASDPQIALSSKSRFADLTVAPFLAKHIPHQYAPLGVQSRPTAKLLKDPNTKYCYRHRPDSKCRRTADEPRMENLQRVCLSCPPARINADRIIGSRNAIASRPAGNLSCLVSFLSSAC